MILEGDCREVLKSLADKSIDCCITSPPYFGLRNYGHDNQLGLEKTPEEYVNNLVAVFREVKRVLKDEGTLWLNLGDTYAMGSLRGKTDNLNENVGSHKKYKDGCQENIKREIPKQLKPKDLIGIPWRVAFALQADDWYLRQDIIWHKPNAMPESVKDRCTKSHEYIFLLSKQSK
jgi:site-specific DNA-methyltransferase (adenine-specific)